MARSRLAGPGEPESQAQHQVGNGRRLEEEVRAQGHEGQGRTDTRNPPPMTRGAETQEDQGQSGRHQGLADHQAVAANDRIKAIREEIKQVGLIPGE